MDSTRSWFKKFQLREGKVKPVVSKKKEMESMNDAQKPPIDEAPLSDITKQRVAAAKQFIENHYKTQKKILQERKERYNISS
ncbi:protein-serine/threonine kinase [Dendrobium catenatum]|uniref:Protein-serine/threonine kinase n=1 Tax=Dendrobium catenatum TaxID=906689 RepID=A0A2I0WXD2_9ASPA|nr:protein-serine/threonine kinase [Dendrobium catenatum]